MNDSPESARSAARTGERIAKLLARAGVASRREIERMIEDGRVKLDGEVLTTPATVLESLRGITVDDQPVSAPEAARLFAFHKPSGLITAERDMAGRPTIYLALRNALPADAPRVMPVGRLDLNTEGLLLLTNDGALKRALELPSSGVERTYRARTFGEISQAQLEELIDGVEIDGVRYGKIDANMERRTGRNQWIELTLTEGKNREVRRVLEHLGLQVSRLLRTSYGPIRLGDLPRGMAAEVDGKMVDELLRQLKVAAPTDVTPRRMLAPKVEGAPAAKPKGRTTALRRPQADDRARQPAPAIDEIRNAGPAKPGARGVGRGRSGAREDRSVREDRILPDDRHVRQGAAARQPGQEQGGERATLRVKAHPYARGTSTAEGAGQRRGPRSAKPAAPRRDGPGAKGPRGRGPRK